MTKNILKRAVILFMVFTLVMGVAVSESSTSSAKSKQKKYTTKAYAIKEFTKKGNKLTIRVKKSDKPIRLNGKKLKSDKITVTVSKKCKWYQTYLNTELQKWKKMKMSYSKMKKMIKKQRKHYVGYRRWLEEHTIKVVVKGGKAVEVIDEKY